MLNQAKEKYFIFKIKVEIIRGFSQTDKEQETRALDANFFPLGLSVLVILSWKDGTLLGWRVGDPWCPGLMADQNYPQTRVRLSQ